MNDEYIKREDAKDAVINIVGWEKIAKYVDEMSKHPSTKDIDYYDALIDAEDVIDDLPPADVAPVRHGRWIKDKMPMYSWGGEKIGEKSTWECSECHDVGFWGYNYCPNCGARMDGDGNEID